MMPPWQRTRTCGELRLDHEGEEVTLNGWVNNWRDHGGLVFIDLRDRHGLTQVVFDPNTDGEMHQQARGLRSEFVVAVTGTVAPRLEGKRNPKLATGDIEVKATKLEVLNRSEVTPFEIGPEAEATSEEIRLRHRYLDLRCPRMQQILELRHRVCKATRDYLSDRGFLEVETPMLGRSTPEGARDFLVPSRVNPGEFYALPQSPQLYKQILMVAGYDRYFQIARCFRDEDLRANRQPEFTQVDIEMSFIDMDDIIGLIEGLATTIMSEVVGQAITPPFPRYTFEELERRYGIDRPDLRFGMEIVDVTGIAHETDFKVFQQAPSVRGLNAKAAAGKYSRKAIDELTEFVGEYGARGLAWLKVDGDSLTSPIAKFIPEALAGQLREAMNAEPGDLLLFVADRYEASHAPLAALRHRLGKELELYDPNEFHFSWCVDFPLLEHDPDTGHWVARHHPFTMPKEEDWPLLAEEPGAVRAKAYDLIVNGEEAAGGTIRLHKPELQEKVFELIGLDEAEARHRFGFLLDALKYGAPPHGGIAMGLDRWVMLLAGLDNIRDCIAFPKTQRATDLMTGAPSPVEPRHLRELGLK